MLYEGSELLGDKGLFKLNCSQHWAPRASSSYAVAASFGNLLRAQNPRTVGLIHRVSQTPVLVGLKAAILSQPLDISQNRKFFKATYASKNAKIV